MVTFCHGSKTVTVCTTCVTGQQSVRPLWCFHFNWGRLYWPPLQSVMLNWLEVCGQEQLDMLVGVVSEVFSVSVVEELLSWSLDDGDDMMAAAGGGCLVSTEMCSPGGTTTPETVWSGVAFFAVSEFSTFLWGPHWFGSIEILTIQSE